MKKKEADKDYLNWESNYKKKVLLYYNYAIGFILTFELLISYKNLQKLFCWEQTVYFMYLPWAFVFNKLSLKYCSTNVAALNNAIVNHIITYITVCTKHNYIAIIITYMGHYHMRSLFITDTLLSRIDTGIISGFLGLTFYRMLNQFYDLEGHCIWDYKLLEADIYDSCFRTIMYNASLYLYDFFNQRKVECLNNLAKEIEEKSKEKERFFACISHELRNPLNSLLASMELLAIAPKGKRAKLLSTAKSCGDSLLHLIGNILDVTKIKDKKMELYYNDTDVTELINRIAMMHQIKAANKGLHFELIGDSSIPPCVKLDSAKITQVLTNLVSNSIKFTDRGSVVIKLSWIPILTENFSKIDFELAIEEAGRESNRENIMNNVEENIKIDVSRMLLKYDEKPRDKHDIFGEYFGPSIEYIENFDFFSKRTTTRQMRRNRETKEKGVLKIEIIDSGIGITPENLEKLFQPFVQADKTISQRFGGTGLGLWISKSITEIMGGNIKVESILNHGANFMVILPLFSGNEERAFQEDEVNLEHVRNQFSGKKMLYVEDISENQLIMSQMLTQLGFEIQLAADGAEGLFQFRAKGINYFDIILTDLRMPNMSGQTMIMKIREFEENLKICTREMIPIIVLTGDPSENEKHKCLQILKANAFLTKPVSLGQLHNSFEGIFRIEEEGDENNFQQEIIIKKILIVEDDKLLNNLITQFLANYEVIQAYSIQEGIQKFTDNYDNIFTICLDGNLADGTGEEFLLSVRDYEREVKRADVENKVKIISISGDEIKRQKKIYKNLFVSYFLQKPFSRNELLTALLELENS